MIGKITSGSSFGGAVGYILKQDGEILDCEGISPLEVKHMAEDFRDQALLNPRVKNMVGHISLNFSPEDKDRLTNKMMTGIAKEYIEMMGIRDTQYLLVRHNDKDHPHCHIIYNRVDNKGKTISDRNIRYRNLDACRILTSKHNLYWGHGKENVKLDNLREPDKTKYEIYYALRKAMTSARNWNELDMTLARTGIEMNHKYNGNTDKKQGVTFTKNGYTFPGSKVDKVYSYGNIEKVLNPKPYQSKHQEQFTKAEKPRYKSPIPSGRMNGGTRKPTIPGQKVQGPISFPKMEKLSSGQQNTYEIPLFRTAKYSQSGLNSLIDAVTGYTKVHMGVGSLLSSSSKPPAEINLSTFGAGSLPIPHESCGVSIAPEELQRRPGESSEAHIRRITALISEITEAMLNFAEEQKRKQEELLKKKKRQIKIGI